jgi:hypothetical protein
MSGELRYAREPTDEEQPQVAATALLALPNAVSIA